MLVPQDYPDREVAVIGLGYVGLTLAAVMAEAGFRVYGVERSETILRCLTRGTAHFRERGLNRVLRHQLARGGLSVQSGFPISGRPTVYIVTVGTPVTDDKRTNLDSIVAVARELVHVIRPNDLVILRSTVRVGVSRQVVKPILDEAKVPYDLAFCPERTLEGRALTELRTLPQIVGGLDDSACLRAGQIFNLITQSIVKVRDLETAEMVKLVNNVQRDLMFAFSNEVAIACDHVGVPVSEVIQAGNVGYPRAAMPKPGPVGGPCLEKDPYIFAESVTLRGGRADLALLGRRYNETLVDRVADFIVSYPNMLVEARVPPRIGILGLAFKGRPETSDLRGSLALRLVASLQSKLPNAKLVGYDPAIIENEALGIGIEIASSAEEAFEGASVVVLQNNNESFQDLDLEKLSQRMQMDGFIYDLWDQIDARDLQLSKGVQYCSLGNKALLPQRKRSPTTFTNAF